MILEILKNDSPILKMVCDNVEDFESAKLIAANMFETLVASKGIGLAAPQVGILQRIIVLSTAASGGQHKKLVMVNPAITFKGPKKVKSTEGCLSLPDISCAVTRSEKVHVRYKDLNGESQQLLMQGIDAICVQHEIDHLSGITMDVAGVVLRNSAIK